LQGHKAPYSRGGMLKKQRFNDTKIRRKIPRKKAHKLYPKAKTLLSFSH